MLRNLILSAAAAGLAAGLLTAALQHVTTTPLILEAERYESMAADLPAGTTPATHDGEAHAAPAAGLERTVSTGLATTVLGVGFSLALLGVMVLSGQAVDGRVGLSFGAAGFAALALAPALGLPPELPGSAAAGLASRQAWWILAALSSAIGLAGLLLGRGHLIRGAGLALIVLPHLVGAPRPESYASAAPAELAGHFAAASLSVTAVFWAVLGFSSGAIYERLARSG
jgi:cobalt transporter subunit CbtA